MFEFVLLPARPVSCILAGRGRPCSTGFTPATPAARSSCASKTPTPPATPHEATEVILSGLRWLGLDWDEGPTAGDPAGPSKGDYGPYFQSQRGEIYRARVQELKDKGLAYDSEGAVKFKMERQPIVIPDLIVGDVTRELTDREQADPDFVIIRSDGQPVFHFVNVVDDLEMKITHVIRGEDHLTNTAKHIALFRAFGVEPPKYAHIPLILNPDGTKMSKRDTRRSLQTYLDEGCVPRRWSIIFACWAGRPRKTAEKLPIAEIIQLFDLPQILRHNARFDLAKLHWLDGEYVREMSDDPFPRSGRRRAAPRRLRSQQISRRTTSAPPWPPAKEKSNASATSAPTPAFILPAEIKIDPALAAKEFTAENKPA